jgi:Transcriptional activator of glycolytic enzymes
VAKAVGAREEDPQLAVI